MSASDKEDDGEANDGATGHALEPGARGAGDHSLRPQIPDLTAQEESILMGLAAGSKPAQIAEVMDVPIESIDAAVATALEKLHRLSALTPDLDA
jgi:DNA-binding NarL/FixJ family response regulator